MQDYDEIRKRFLAGESQQHIAKTMEISRNTVKEIQSHGNGDYSGFPAHPDRS